MVHAFHGGGASAPPINVVRKGLILTRRTAAPSMEVHGPTIIYRQGFEAGRAQSEDDPLLRDPGLAAAGSA